MIGVAHVLAPAADPLAQSKHLFDPAGAKVPATQSSVQGVVRPVTLEEDPGKKAKKGWRERRSNVLYWKLGGWRHQATVRH